MPKNFIKNLTPGPSPKERGVSFTQRLILYSLSAPLSFGEGPGVRLNYSK